jgi:hypothetical protein
MKRKLTQPEINDLAMRTVVGFEYDSVIAVPTEDMTEADYRRVSRQLVSVDQWLKRRTTWEFLHRELRLALGIAEYERDMRFHLPIVFAASVLTHVASDHVRKRWPTIEQPKVIIRPTCPPTFAQQYKDAMAEMMERN